MTRLERMLAASGLAATEQAELSELLAPLDVTDALPEPSPELAALFGEPAEGDADAARVADHRVLRRWRVRTATAGAVVLAVSGVGATGLSAAANTLPSAVQHHVSQFSQHFLPFAFPEPPTRIDRPLSQGRFALAPETTAPHGDQLTTLGGVIGASPPQAVVGSGRPTQAGLHDRTPGPTDPGREGAQTTGHGYAAPSASPSPSPSPSPSDGPSASASPDKPGGRPTSLTPSPSPTPDSSPDKGPTPGHGGAGKPGKSPGADPAKSPGKTSGTGNGADTGSTTAGAGKGSFPGAGQGGDGPGLPGGTPTVPDPGGVLPVLPDPGALPEGPVAP